jgi:hypothetical protein
MLQKDLYVFHIFIFTSLFDAVKDKIGSDLHDCATWFSDDVTEFEAKAKAVGVLSTENEDVRSLRELLVIGLKGIAAYADHAAVLGVTKDEIWNFLYEALASTTQNLGVDEMVAMVMKAGEISRNDNGRLRPGQYAGLRQPGNNTGQYRCGNKSRYPDFRP